MVIKMENKFNKYVDSIINDLITINSMFGLYNYLYEKRNSKSDEINISPAFFSLTMEALLNYSVLSLARLYKKNDGGITINKFLDFIEMNQKIFYNEDGSKKNKYSNNNIVKVIISDKKVVLESQDKIKKLIITRDKVLAHNDPLYYLTREDIWKSQSLKKEDIQELIYIAADIINHYLVEYCGEYRSIILDNLYDVDKVLDILTNHVNNN